ncbi:MAG: hypothetical protein LBF27_14185 [Sphingobacterium sp.]|jgi:YD repeat-containing protein|nr:hypothetical protein [Sphingobacterium sp.]
MRKSIALFVCFLVVHPLFAQMEQPSAAYMRSLNSYVRGAPETSQMMKFIDYPVNLSTGTPNISIPFYTVAGKGIDVPIVLSYNAGGGVKVSDMASNAGLGFLLGSGGEVSREIRGLADETSSIGYMYKSRSVAYYDSIKPRYDNDPVALAHLNEWIDVAEGRMDLEPDIYYFSCGGYSGKFIYDERRAAFVNMNTSDSRLKFQFSSNVFTIVADNGNRYVFAAREQSHASTLPLNGVGLPTPASQLQTTSWKLSKIINADATDSIMINYDYYSAAYYSLGSSTTYTVVQGNGNRSPVLNTYNKNMVEGYTKLKSIVSRTDSVSFVYEATARQDYTDERALSRVVICARGGGIKDIFKLHTSYFDRPLLVGNNPIGDLAKKSLRLDSLTEYGNSESNANPLRYRFTYNSAQMQNRFSYAQDMWGYANDNQFADHLALPQYYPLGTSPILLPGADRTPDEAKMKAGILERIDLPTGGFTTFEYEANTVNNPTLATAANTIGVAYSISEFKSPGQYFESTYVDSFIVNEAPDAAVNGNRGGVIASLSMAPFKADAILNGGSSDNTLPTYRLDRALNPPQPIGEQPFNSISTQGPAYTSGLYLPNGKYYIKVQDISSNNLNHPDKMNIPVRNLTFSITFNISDTTGASKKYMAGGLRIKRIVSQDQFSGTAKIREFAYGGADTTFGRLIGPNFTSYYETKPNEGQFFVRMGANAMPGQGSLGSNVFYPKVFETVKEAGRTYRTYHDFLYIEPNYFNVYPFVPGKDNEYARGKETQTMWTQWTSSGIDQVLKKTNNVYDNSPPAQSSDPMMSVRAIKTSIDAYAYNTGGGFPMFTIMPYNNIFSYVYLTSDSMTTYDLTNGIQLKSWNRYDYGANNNLPITTISMDSKGSKWEQRNGYALDASESSLETEPSLAAQLDAANRVGEVLASRTYKDGQLINQMFKKAHFSGSQFLMDSVLYAEYDNALESDGKVLDYDTYGNPLTIEGRGSRFRKYIWRKERNLALATCSMAKKGSFVFTSFEYPNEYSTLQEGNRTTASAFSGNYAYTLNGTMIFGGFNPGGNLEVYAWLSQGSFMVNGYGAVSTGRTKDNWTLYRVEVPYATTVTIAGSCRMDQLAIVPAGSVMEGNVFDTMDRITAKLGSNMQTTFFDYDAFGRLQYIRDEQGNILKSNTYGYQVSQ